MNKDLKTLIQKYRERGWTIDKTGRGHWCFKGPHGELAYTAGTPSDWRSFHNLKAKLNREERRIDVV